MVSERIQCWIDGKNVIDVNIKDRTIGMRAGSIEESIPLGLSTFSTSVEYRNIVWRNLAPGSPG